MNQVKVAIFVASKITFNKINEQLMKKSYNCSIAWESSIDLSAQHVEYDAYLVDAEMNNYIPLIRQIRKLQKDAFIILLYRNLPRIKNCLDQHIDEFHEKIENAVKSLSVFVKNEIEHRQKINRLSFQIQQIENDNASLFRVAKSCCSMNPN